MCQKINANQQNLLFPALGYFIFGVHFLQCIGSSSKSAFEVAAAIVLPFLLLLER